MLTAKKLRENCEKEIKKLQKICDHSKIHWSSECWAPGHFTGRCLKICDVCEKVLKKKGASLLNDFHHRVRRTR